MKVAILQCDNVLEPFQPQFGDYDGMIRNLFAELGDVFEFKVFDLRQGHYPDDIHAYDFFITTGSKVSVYDNQPWIEPAIAFVRQLDSAKKKLIGICFGHQLIAKARGCEVAKSAKGWGIGVAVNRILTSPIWMNETKSTLHMLVSHQDQVLNLPEDALVIAASDFCPYFFVQWSKHFLSVQGHPEFSPEYSRAMMNMRRTIIPAERIEVGLASLSLDLDNALFARWIMDFVGQ